MPRAGLLSACGWSHAQRVAYTDVLVSFLLNLKIPFCMRCRARLRLHRFGNAETADLASMFRCGRLASRSAPRGIAFIMTSVSTAFAPNGYSVVDAPCFEPKTARSRTNLAYNMGLRDDRDMDTWE